MQNFCNTPFPQRQCLICEFPPCICDKCKLLRSEGKPDKNTKTLCAQITSENKFDQNKEGEKETQTGSKSEQEELANCIKNIQNKKLNSEIKPGQRKMQQVDKRKEKLFKIPSLLTVFTFDFTLSNLQSVLFDIVGVISFFIMTTAIFWVTIAQYLWYFINIIIDSGRKQQLISLILFVLLCASITFHAFQGRSSLHHHQRLPSKLQNGSATKQPAKCNHPARYCHHKKCCHHNLKTSIKNPQNLDQNILAANAESNQKPENGNLCTLCAKELKAEPNTNSQPVISDEEALEMYKRYKLYTVPTEMKTPPSIGYIVEVLTGFYHRMTNSVPTTIP